MDQSQQYWKTKTLRGLNSEEWESLCDGCGKCCLNKLEDEDNGDLLFTNISCRLLDSQNCACTNYKNRKSIVPHCSKLTPKKVFSFQWLPKTCAYRLIANGDDLPDWHHLVCGDRERVHLSGNSVRGKVVSEDDIEEEELEDYVVDWLD